MPLFNAFRSAGHWPCPPKYYRVFPRTRAPPSRRFRSLLAKVASILPTMTSCSSSVLQPGPRPFAHHDRRDARVVFWVTNLFAFNVPLLMRARITQSRHSNVLPAILIRHTHSVCSKVSVGGWEGAVAPLGSCAIASSVKLRKRLD